MLTLTKQERETMNIKIFVTILAILQLTSTVSLADRLLDRPETLNILRTLTDTPHKKWISAGTIVATHEEYRASVKDSNLATPKIISNEYRMITDVTVRFNGEQFYWQIDLLSRSESPADANLPGSPSTRQFDLNANANRIFAWDGQKYTTYFRPINNATVKEAAKLKVQPAVNGPLTAGFIPWGYGHYTYQELTKASLTAIESSNQIQLTLTLANGEQMVFVMAPDKGYAVLSQVTKKVNGSFTVNTYGNFLQVANRWVPMTIMIEQYNNAIATQNLAASDLWNFTSIDSNTPAEDSFKVDFETDAIVEYHTSLAAKTLIYRYRKATAGVDTDALLIDKLASDASEAAGQNCATAALKYVASKLGKNASDQQLAQLVQGAARQTSLYALKQYTQSLGLYCRAVKTDLQTLKGLSNCQIILHIPGKNHYVVLGTIDDANVRIIDLTSRKFFERFKTNEFELEWSSGTALIMSNQPIPSQGTLMDIDDTALQTIVGAAGFACNRLIQNYAIFLCNQPIAGLCLGDYEEYFERWGCGTATTGTCPVSMLPRLQTTLCINDPYDPYECTISGEWITYYIRACL
jgi:hypothetical protein